MTTDDLELDVPHPTLPSWLVSLSLHLTLLVLLAWMVRVPASHSRPGLDRPVGITLAQRSDEAVTYLDSREATVASTPAADPQHARADSAQLPDSSALSELDLPLSALSDTGTLPLPVEGVLGDQAYAPGVPSRLRANVDMEQVLAEDAALRQQQRPAGPTTHVSLFGGVAAEGRSFVFVIDRSASMGRDGLGLLDLARKEFQRALQPLESVHQFQIVAYNHERVYFGSSDKLVAATEENKRRVEQFMRGLVAMGATVHFSAIMTALNRSPDVLFLLTDGNPALSDAELVQIRRRAAGRTTIHCLQFGDRPWDGEENFMPRLARENGGSYRYLDVNQLHVDE